MNASVVILSYASQDAEALRAAGVEVWFDRSELRGGEARDRSIRRQLKECAPFVPMVSKHGETPAAFCERLRGRWL